MKNEPGMAYNTKKLNKFFAVISVIFLISVLWMVLDDFIRPWKVVQIKALEVKKQVLQEKIEKENESINNEELNQILADIKTAEKAIADKKDVIDQINEDNAVVEKKIYVQNMNNGIYGSKAGAYQFKYEHYRVDGKEKEASKYKVLMDEMKEKFDQGRDELKALQVEEKNIKEKLKNIKEELTDLERSLKKQVGAKDLLVQSLKGTKKDFIWFLRNGPFLDYLDPTIKIQQIVLNNITDDRYFRQTEKVDRCITCHLFIGEKGYENQPNPYKTHPRIDELAVGLKSAHPMKKFGCTSCHGGEGHRVNDFNSPAHMPQNEKQQEEWVEKYHWHEPHKVPQAVYPLQYSEASCVKCHRDVERVALADKLNHGRELIENYGCYGCHKIKGYEHLKKPGPSLLKINAKVSKEFIKNWIWSPQSFNAHSRMPSFFGQSNNKQPEFMKKNITEVNAMAEYIVEKAKDYTPFEKYAGGNAEKGKQLIQTVGCIACHQVEGIDEPYNKVKSQKGPYLSGTGTKVDKDWLVSWLLKPSHYQEDTIMPSFRLSNAEANNIAAYLLTLKNKTFDGLTFAEIDNDTRDEILVEYFSQFEPISLAKEKLAKLDDHERTIELGKRSIGKYGCYSCHNIEGFADDRPPIGPELSAVGSKPIHQFGYGQQVQVEHTRHAWITAHLQDPRRWDIGVPKPFKDLNRMPNFYLKDDEIEAITTVMLGQVSDFVPLAGKKLLTANEKIVEKGKKVANKFNCYGCHKVSGFGGKIAAAFEDDLNMGPPWLVNEGHRVYQSWLHNFLRNVHTIRPYMIVRMPTFNFSDEDLNSLTEFFKYESDQLTFDNPPKIVWEPGEKEAAAKIFNELACTTCHTGGFNSDDPQGPNLHYAKTRLHKSWIKKWLTNPTAVMPYTPMPDFWSGGTESAVEGVLGDDPQKQIEAVAKYILDMGYDKTPPPL
ncbi:MAG: c-type cytochrome [Halobacteriovoraceae bacterium]|nr:c-type cytochrome [Halobacteriovoraceae bacterium]